jgi:septal ring factor EnvC (AmiA/AmiB activator)
MTHSEWNLLCLGFSASLFVSGCETTGNPYEDSFFFSSAKAETALEAKKAELGQLHAQISSERARISEMRNRLSASRQSNSGLKQEISRLDSEAATLQTQSAPEQAEKPTISGSSVELIRLQSAKLSRQLQELEQKLD